MSVITGALPVIADAWASCWFVLLTSAVKGVGLLAAIWLAAAACGRQSAAARHCIWTIGVVGVLLLPLLVGVLPTWGILPAEWSLSPEATGASEPRPSIAVLPVETTTVPIGTLPPELRVAQTNAPLEPSAKATNPSPPVLPSAMANGTSVDEGTETRLTDQRGAGNGSIAEWLASVRNLVNGSQPQPWLWSVWLAGSSLLLGRILAGQWALHRLARRCHRVSAGRAYKELKQLAAEIDLQRPVALYESADCATPMAWGIFSARLLVPSGTDAWSDSRLRSVLLHELAHIARWDYATQMLAQLAQCIYWFNPLVWLAERRMRYEREQASDDRVLSTGTRATDYATHLLEVTGRVRPSRLLDVAAVGMGRRSQLESRIHAVLDQRRRRVPLSGSSFAALFATMVLVAAGLGSAGAAARVVESIDAHDLADGSSNGDALAQRTLPNWELVPRALRGHVYSVVWSPDGQRVAFGEGHVVRIHSARTLSLVAAAIGHTSQVRTVAWSPDGSRLASGGDDGTVRVWDNDGALLAVFSDHELGVTEVAWSGDGRHIASAGNDGTVRICTPDGLGESVYRGHRAPVTCVAWSADGTRLVSGDENQSLHIWQAEGANTLRLGGETGGIVTVEWSPDGKRFAAVSHGQVDFQDTTQTTSTVSIWTADGTAGAVIRSQRGEIQDVAWSPDGQSFASGGDDGSVWLWKSDGTPLNVIEGRNREVNTLDFSPDGTRLVVGSRNSLCILNRDGSHGAKVLASVNFAQSVAWSSNGSQIAIGCEDGSVRIFGADQSAQWVAKPSEAPVHAVAWSPDGSTLAVGSNNRQVSLYDRDGGLKRRITVDGSFPYSLAWHPDGKSIAAGCHDKTVRILDLPNESQRVVGSHDRLVHSVAWSPNGKWLASAGFDSAIRLWTPDGKAGPVFDGHEGGVNEVAWSPDSKRLVSGDLQAVRVWNIDGTPGAVLPAGDVIDVRFSPDGTKIAAAIWDMSVRIWNADGTPMPVESQHSAPVVAIDWSPDSGHIVTGSYDSSFCVYDAKTGKSDWIGYLLASGKAVVVETSPHAIEGYSQSVDREFRFAVAEGDGKPSLIDYATLQRRLAPENQ